MNVSINHGRYYARCRNIKVGMAKINAAVVHSYIQSHSEV